MIKISIIGRLTGPKGDITFRILTEVAPFFPQIQWSIIGGPITDRFLNLKSDNVIFTDFVRDVKPFILQANLVIGAGRVAIESLKLDVGVLAIGEKKYVGIINKNNIEKAQISNFGDCAKDTNHDLKKLKNDLQEFIKNKNYKIPNLSKYLNKYSTKNVGKNVETVYTHAITRKNFKKFNEIPILMYHRVLKIPPKNSKFNIYITTKKLEEQLQSLQKRGFEFTTFNDIKKNIKVKQPIILTFDDGYEDNYLNLLPLLKKYNAKAVIYCLGDRNIDFNIWDVKLGEIKIKLMNNEQILACHNSGLIEIGSHTLDHQNLTTLSYEEAKKQIYQSKNNLEKLIKNKIISFAYPYGSYSKRDIELCKNAGYDFAIGTVNGPLKFVDDFYKIRRIQIFPSSKKLDFWKKTSGFYLRLCKLKSKDF